MKKKRWEKKKKSIILGPSGACAAATKIPNH
jgi:hypothetical protein